MQIQNVTIFCFFASYLCAFVLELTLFLRQSRVMRVSSLVLAVAGLFAQTTYLVVRSRHSELPPLLGSTHDWLLVSAWLVMALFMGVRFWDRSNSLGIFVLPLVLVMVAASRFVSRTPNPRVEASYWWSLSHAAFWVTGISGVILALIVSMMYLVQHSRLKHKKADSPAMHLFSLERLNRFNWWLIVVSVPLLTLGMLSGLWMTFVASTRDGFSDLLNVAFLANAAIWIAMAFLFGWLLGAKHTTGRVVAKRTILACGFLLVIVLAVRLLNRDAIHDPDLREVPVVHRYSEQASAQRDGDRTATQILGSDRPR